jgi:hypothetical protein
MPYTDVEIKKLRKRTAWIAGVLASLVAAAFVAYFQLLAGYPDSVDGAGSGSGSAAVSAGSADASGSGSGDLADTVSEASADSSGSGSKE